MRLCVALKCRDDADIKSQIYKGGLRIGIGVDFQLTLNVTVKIVIPIEKVFGESILVKKFW